MIQLLIGQAWAMLPFSIDGNRTRLSLWRHVTHCSEWALLVGEAWREIRPFLECVKKTYNKALIFWKELAISKLFKDIFANFYIFYLKIKKSCRCKNLDIFPLNLELWMFHPHMMFSKDISNLSPVKSRIYFENLIQNGLLYLHFRKKWPMIMIIFPLLFILET